MTTFEIVELLLLGIIIIQGCLEVFYSRRVERHYRAYFEERRDWRLAQRKSRKKPEEILNKEEGQQ